MFARSNYFFRTKSSITPNSKTSNENQLRLAGIDVALLRKMAFRTNVIDESQAQDIILQTEDSDSQATLPGSPRETSYYVGAEAKT